MSGRSIASVMLALLASVTWAEPAERSATIGRVMNDFRLRDIRGAERSLSEFTHHKLTVLAFVGTECPLAKSYGPRLAELAKTYEPKDVAFVGISSNQQDGVTALVQYAKTSGIGFPILKDVGNGVADQFGARRTPEVFVLDSARTVRYLGRIDDQFGIGYTRKKPTHRDLADALDELLAGKPVTRPVTEAPGCFIGRVTPASRSGPVTYSQHIAPLLERRCVDCHRPGEIGPFSLTSYEEVLGWTETIREVVEQERMPPWHANPAYGHFANDSRLTTAEKQMILNWIENGAPPGDAKELPPRPPRTDGWRIPKPDVVLAIPKPFDVPVTGDVPYEFIVVDPGFTEDKWVRAAEIRPGSRSAVHHVLIFVQPPTGRKTDRNGGFATNWLAATVPGARPMILPEGTAKRIPAGSRLLFQMHYTPDGVPHKDVTQLGLVFADPRTVRREVTTEMAANEKLQIPPRAPNHQVEATSVIEADTLLLELMPHTHLRGKSFRFEALYPDGKSEILLDVPRYDFNWQNSYVLAEPKRLPQGTKIHCIAHYDNSPANPANPDPEATVRWGDQTWEEMMIGYYNVMPAEQDMQKQPLIAAKYTPRPLPPLDEHVRKLAAQALDSQAAFDAFAAAVRQLHPQVDRVCVTTYSHDRLRVVKAAYPGPVQPRFAESGFESPGKYMALPYFAITDQFTVLPDLAKVRAADFQLASKTLSSSVHVPIVLQGTPGTVNFWSKDKAAFAAQTHDQLRALAAALKAGAR